MTVQVIQVDPIHPDPEYIRPAARALRQGKLVAFPTETVYGLGADALNRSAVARIFEAKGRPSYDPLIVHLAGAAWLERAAAVVPPLALRLAEAFWPGPLTLILAKRPEIPDLVTSGLDTVAVRVPDHPVALALLEAADVLVAAPSANRFGRTSPTRASHVLADLEGRIDVLVDGGETRIGIESTVLDLSGPRPTILRPGGVTREQLLEVLGDVAVRAVHSAGGPQSSPGTLRKHYSPRAVLYYFTEPEREKALAGMRQLIEEAVQSGKRVGLLILEEDRPVFDDLPVVTASLGSARNLWQAARRLYAGMRSLDEQQVDVIFVRDLGTDGPGLALRDRLQRAASKLIP